MIKGVNKKVVEINNPRSIYFEKAVFYLKPNMSLMPEKLIGREAEEMVRELIPSKERKKAARWKILVCISLAVAVVSVTAAVAAAML